MRRSFHSLNIHTYFPFAICLLDKVRHLSIDDGIPWWESGIYLPYLYAGMPLDFCNFIFSIFPFPELQASFSAASKWPDSYCGVQSGLIKRRILLHHPAFFCRCRVIKQSLLLKLILASLLMKFICFFALILINAKTSLLVVASSFCFRRNGGAKSLLDTDR